MPIVIIDGFQLNANKPIDYRIVASSSVQRLLISTLTQSYDGLKVFQQDDRKTYIYNASTLSWDIEGSTNITGAGATGYMPYFSSATNIIPGVMYQGSGNIGLNTNDPKSAFQVNPNFGTVPPITIHNSTNAKIAHNWYNNGTDQTFDLAQGSTRLNFDGGNFSIGVRQPGDPNGLFRVPIYATNTGVPYLTSNTFVYLTSDTISISATTSILLNHNSGDVKIIGPDLISGVSFKYGSGTTFSATTIQNNILAPSSFEIIGCDVAFGSEGSNINLRSGNTTGFGDGTGGKILIQAGYGNSFIGNGYGGSIILQGGDGTLAGAGGTVSLRGGYNANTGRRGNVNLGINRLIVSDYDLFAYVHNSGTLGIGDSGNNVTPWNYPSLASGQFALVTGDVTNITNLTSVVPSPAIWMRVGNVVHVCGQMVCSITSANVHTAFTLKLPINSYFGANNYWILNGVGKVVNSTAGQNIGGGDVISIFSSGDFAGYNKAEFKFYPSTATSGRTIVYSFQYIVGSYPDSPFTPAPSPPPAPPPP